MGIVGGGTGAFIGPVHCMAARLDDRIELVAGALSGDPVRSREMGERVGIQRSYASFEELLDAERAQDLGLDFITIATPNYLHATMTREAMQAGFHIMCEKPAAATATEMRDLVPAIAAANRHYALAHAYTGYPMVRQARAMCADRELGEIRSVSVEYYQGWLAEPVERSGNKQAAWRSDPALAGTGGCVADIGVHAFNLAEFVTGLAVSTLNADMLHAVPGRALDDGCNILMRFSSGAKGVLSASQVATGARNDLRLRVNGSEASLDWRQERPSELVIAPTNGPTRIYHAAQAGLAPDAASGSRLPPGHPEGFIEALANLYGDFADVLQGLQPRDRLQGVDAAMRGMAFIEAAIASDAESRWRALAVPAIEGGV